MNISFKNPKLIKDSASLAFAVLAATETILAVSGVSLASIIPNQKWWVLLLAVLLVYAVAFVALYFILKIISSKGTKIHVNGITIDIRQGDLFASAGWKVIPFNEHFDTTVDNNVINEDSLNGQFILNHVNDIDELNSMIAEDASRYAIKNKNGRRPTFRLGHSIAYKSEYIFLALTHFNEQNEAHISVTDYIDCLMLMWKEIRRLYANKPICLPLIGSGVTSFDDVPQKSNLELLKYMLLTLKASGENLNQPITIVLTKDALQEIDLYELKGAI